VYEHGTGGQQDVRGPVAGQLGVQGEGETIGWVDEQLRQRGSVSADERYGFGFRYGVSVPYTFWPLVAV
jgi:hypothetical protein